MGFESMLELMVNPIIYYRQKLFLPKKRVGIFSCHKIVMDTFGHPLRIGFDFVG